MEDSNDDQDAAVERKTRQTVHVWLRPGLPDLERRYVRNQHLIPTSLNLEYTRSGDGLWVHAGTRVTGPRRLKAGGEGEMCSDTLTSYSLNPLMLLPEWVVDRIERYRPQD